MAIGRVDCLHCSRMSTRGAIISVLPVLAGCFTGNIQRSARVPHPGVPLSSGQPLASSAELSAGLTNATDMMAPRVGNASQAVEVPSTEMRDELRLKLGRRGTLSVVYEDGFAATSHKPDATQAPIGGGDVRGYGVSYGYSFETSTPGLSIGTTVESIVWSLPYVQYETCTNGPDGGVDCPSMTTTISHGRAYPLTLGLGVTPSYRSGAITVFGGLFGRNHPTTTRKEMNVALNDGDDVRSGPFNLLVHAGVELQLADRLSALLLIHQDFTADPVRYGPGIGIGIAGRIGQ
jgi:hypothetical protein